MKKLVPIALIIIVVFAGLFVLLQYSNKDNKSKNIVSNSSSQNDKNQVEKFSYINKNGNTIAQRINVPEGYKRTTGDEYAEFLRNQELLPDGSPVLLYNNSKKSKQNVQIAVLSIDVGKKNLQQCADSVLRLRSEYLFKSKQYDKINFHLTNGQEFPYIKYRDGYRLIVEGNKTSLIKKAQPDNSYEAFRQYLDVLFTYAGTLSLSNESKNLDKSDMKIGDIFIKGGTPGHCVIIVDMCENDKGEKMFLLAQGYMPAQQIHVLKNPESKSPWYSVNDLKYPFKTPEFTFEENSLKRTP